jgi:hypothetical protein
VEKLVRVRVSDEAGNDVWVYGYDRGPMGDSEHLRVLHVPRSDDWPDHWTSEHKPDARLMCEFEEVDPVTFFKATGIGRPAEGDVWHPYTMAS